MGFFVLFATWGYANSFGAYQAYYSQTLPESPSTISWIGGIQIFLSLVTGILSGRLLDAGFFVPVFFVGIVIQLLGIFLMSISTQYWQLFLTQGVLSGLGAGIYFTPAVSLISTYFDKRRGLAVGLVTTGNSAGGIVYPLIVRELIPKLGFAVRALRQPLSLLKLKQTRNDLTRSSILSHWITNIDIKSGPRGL